MKQKKTKKTQVHMSLILISGKSASVQFLQQKLFSTLLIHCLRYTLFAMTYFC